MTIIQLSVLEGYLRYHSQAQEKARLFFYNLLFYYQLNLICKVPRVGSIMLN